MKIIIVGLGNVGQTLAFELSKEDNDITVIDNREGVVQDFASQYDIMGVIGNGSKLFDTDGGRDRGGRSAYCGDRLG